MTEPLPRLARDQAPALPERVVQFGTGALLRGLVDDVIDAANRDGRFGGSIVAIGSTGSGRDASLNAQGGLFTLVEQGLENGLPVRRHRVVSSIRRALSAVTEWEAVLAVARDPAIELVFSNTTEIGIVFDESDAATRKPVPTSFPAKLTAFLDARATALQFAPERAPVVIPCELIEHNGDRLRDIVLRMARAWNLDSLVTDWIERHVVFTNTLVDRIVTGDPGPMESARLEAMFGYRDEMITVCEPYRLLAIEGNDALRERLRFTGPGTGVLVIEDVAPFRERKVRILNGAHTTMVSAALLAGFQTVRETIEDDRFGRFVRRAIFDEIVPTLDAPGGDEFGHEVLARFANPYLNHALADITLHGTAKMRVRVVPSILELPRRTGRTPEALAFGFAAHLLLRSRKALELNTLRRDDEGRRIEAHWAALRGSDDSAFEQLAYDVCGDQKIWGADLRAHGFADAVATHLISISRQDISAALDIALAATSRPDSSPNTTYA